MNKLGSDNATELGVAVLRNFGVTPDRNWFWIGATAHLGLAVLFNILFTFALAYLDSPGKPQATILEEAAKVMEVDHEETREEPKSVSVSAAKTLGEMVIQNRAGTNYELNINEDSSSLEAANSAPKRGMVLPFTPLSMSFENVNYYVDMPLGTYGHIRAEEYPDLPPDAVPPNDPNLWKRSAGGRRKGHSFGFGTQDPEYAMSGNSGAATSESSHHDEEWDALREEVRQEKEARLKMQRSKESIGGERESIGGEIERV